MAALKQRFPEMHWHRWEADGQDMKRAGAALVFGRPVDTVLQVDRAEVILAVDSDFLDAARRRRAKSRA